MRACVSSFAALGDRAVREPRYFFKGYEMKKRTTGLGRLIKRTVFIVFMLALVGFFTLLFGGCTPQAVKKSGALAQQAVTVAKANAEAIVDTLDNQEDDATAEVTALALRTKVIQPLEEALAFFRSVMQMVGYPKDLDVYTPGDPANAELAKQAMTQAQMATMIRDEFSRFAKKKLPDALGKHIPDPVADKMSWEKLLGMIAAVVAGYGGTKLGGKGIAKVLNKEKKNG